MIPYSRQVITTEDKKRVKKVLNSNFLTQGELLNNFEKKLAATVNSRFATGFNSATSALHISCLALGIKKGDTVWTCTNSFVASANCALYCGAKVDLIDIDYKNFNINILDLEKKLRISQRKNKLPKVLIPVHFGGFPCDMEKIFNLSKKYKFKIIEDASHALGAKYKNEKIGSCKFSDITVFSFHPVKIITTAEGGAALSNSKKIDAKLKLLRNHGITRNKDSLKKKNKLSWYYEFQELGFNYRLNEIQSVLGISQLKNLKKWIKYRNKLAQNYRDKLKHLPISMPQEKKGYYSSYHLFVILIEKNKKGLSRDDLFKALKKNNIESNVHYIPIHSHPYFKRLGFKEKNFPIMSKYFKKCLSLPLHAGLTFKDQKKNNKIFNKLFGMKIALGTAQFEKNYGINRINKNLTFEEKKGLIFFVKKNGIKTIDTASSYDTAEKDLGKIGVKKLNIITKLPKLKKKVKIDKQLISATYLSLKKLKLRNLYGVLVHHFEDLMSDKGKDYVNSLIALKRKGIVKKIGVSLYDIQDLKKIIRLWKPDIIQIPYNVFDQRLHNISFLNIIKKYKIEIHVRSIFLQGLLVKKNKENKFKKWNKLFNNWFLWCEKKKIEPYQAAYLFVKKNKNIKKIIIGVESLEQMKNILRIKKKINKFPNFRCEDKMLINPYNWSKI